MQRAAGEIRGEEPGDAGLALKAENFKQLRGCGENALRSRAAFRFGSFRRGFLLTAPAFLP